MFQISDLSKSFGGRSLFEGVTWQINPGDRWGLVGPNGVGKTTLLKMLAGEDPIEHGSISKQRNIRLGYLAQEVRRSRRIPPARAECSRLAQKRIRLIFRPGPMLPGSHRPYRM